MEIQDVIFKNKNFWLKFLTDKFLLALREMVARLENLDSVSAMQKFQCNTRD